MREKTTMAPEKVRWARPIKYCRERKEGGHAEVEGRLDSLGHRGDRCLKLKNMPSH